MNADPASIPTLSHWARLALEHHIRHYLIAAHLDPSVFALFCQALYERYGDLHEEALQQWALLHLELLERVWGVIRDDCTRSWLPAVDREIADDPTRFEFLWPLLRPHPRSPDWLLLRMLRDADRLELWLNHRRVGGEGAGKWVEETRTQINEVRSRLLGCSHDLRGVTVRATWRLRGQVKHLRVMDEQRHRIAFVEIGWGLKVIQLDPGTGRHTPLLDLPSQHQRWRGLVTTLAAGPALEQAVGGDEAQPRHLFLATDEGELHLLRLHWNGATAAMTPRWSQDARMEVRCCRPLTIGNCAGLLLGGRNENGAPRLSLMKIHPTKGFEQPLPLWTGAGEGLLRKLVLDPRSNRLWSIDREQGFLYHWQVPSWVFIDGDRPAPWDAPSLWLDVRSRLYSLQQGGEDNRLLICGGHDGMVYALDAHSGELRWTVGCGNSIKRADYLPTATMAEEQRGVWLLGGEFRDAVILDNQGAVQTIIEEVGPLSGIFAYERDARLLLCGLDGRILLFETEQPSPRDPLTGEADLSTWLHPMRSGEVEPLDGAGLAHCLERYYPEVVEPGGGHLPREALPVTALLEQAFQTLTRPAPNRSLIRQLKRFSKRGEPQRLGWLLRRLLRAIQKKEGDEAFRRRAANVGLVLCAMLWRELDHPKMESDVCHVAGQILIFLETLRVGRYSCPPASPLPMEDASSAHLIRLLSEINRCLWWTLNREGCPGSLDNETRRRDLQLSQVVRNWAHLHGQEPIGQRLACLCENLRVLWHPDPIAPLGWRISGVLRLALPLTPEAERQWQKWLIDVVQTSSQVSSKELDLEGEAKRRTKEQQAPRPLVLLEDVELRPLGTTEVSELKRVWGDNVPWQRWIDRLASLLFELDQAGLSAEPPPAWKKWRIMVELLSHFAETGQSQFTYGNGYTLLEFWWPRLVRKWRWAIEEARAALIEDFKDNPERYLEVTATEDRWRDARNVELHLTLVNHGPNDLRIDQIEGLGAELSGWQGPRELKAGPSHSADIAVKVTTYEPDLLQGTLNLSCFNLFSGERVSRDIPVHQERGLKRFTSEPEWQVTWARLDHLLTEGRLPLWIDGHALPGGERSRLKELILDKYQIDVDRDLTPVSSIGGNCLDRSPLFSPDLALGAPPGRLLEQVHALLHSQANEGFNFLALAIWRCRERREGFQDCPIPPSVIKALGERIPSRERVETLLRALLDGDDTTGAMERFFTGLTELPEQALGAWCRGDPLYRNPDVDIGSATLEERYAAPATLLGAVVWSELDRAEVPEEQIADWLGITPEVAHGQREARSALWGIIGRRGEAQSRDSEPHRQVAESLLRILGASSISKLKTGSFFSKLGIDVLHNRFPRCYVLPSNITSQARTRLKSADSSLWLCPDWAGPPAGLPGLAVTLDEDQYLRLVHARSPDEAHSILNQVAATQHPIEASRVFRIADGMGQLVAEHFYGRDDELAAACRAVQTSDMEAQGILVIGGRRMGKTSFKERLIYDLMSDPQAGDFERLFILLDLQEFPRDRHMTQAHVEYRFFKHLYNALHDTEYPFPPEQQWPEDKKDSSAQRDNTRDHFRALLRTIKSQTRHAAVLVLDETEHFAQMDAHNGSQTMAFLRELVYERQICLVATSYPHGKGQKYALQHLEKDTAGSHYNTFTEKLFITRWAPEAAWDYLRSKLSGFGIRVPLYLRDEVLWISRGIPWIVHLLGKEICGLGGESGARRLISLDQWSRIKENALAQIREEVRTTVETQATVSDDQAQVKFSPHPESRFSGGRLWGALHEIAARYEPPRTWAVRQDRSMVGKKLCAFHVETLYRAFDKKIESKRIHEVLNRLTASTVLEGDYEDPETFYFSNDLLPMVVRERREQKR